MPYSDPARGREAHAVYMRERYRSDDEFRRKHQAAVKARRAKARKEAQAWLRSFKSVAVCARCGEHEPCTLDFHHIDPTAKESSVASAIYRDWSLARIQREVAKCIVLCANCHRKEHAGL